MNPINQDDFHAYGKPADDSSPQNLSYNNQPPCSYYNPQTDQFEQIPTEQNNSFGIPPESTSSTTPEQDYYHVYLQYHQTPNPFSSEIKFVPGVGFVKLSAVDKERQRLKKASTLIGLSFLMFLLVSFLISNFIIYLFQLVYSGLFISQDGMQQILNNPLLNQVFLCLNYAIPVLLAFWMLKQWMRIPLSAALPVKNLSAKSTFLAVGVSLGAIVIASYTSSLLSTVLSFFGLEPVMVYYSPPTSPGALVIYYFTFAVLAAVLEEFAFRGVIMQSLRRYGDSFALLASSVLFALLHGNLVQAPSAFIFGLVLGFFVLKTGSIWIGLIVHFINNFCSLTLQVLSPSLGEATTEVIGISVNLLFLIAGLVCLLLLSKNSDQLWEFNSQGSRLVTKDKIRIFFGSPIMFGAIVVFVINMFQMLRIIKR